MRSFLAACFVLLMGASATALAADAGPQLDQEGLQSRFHSEARTYFREHRLRAYERTRAGLRQGATCVTAKAVCWIGEPLAQGVSCSCETRRFGTMEGTVGG
jgi:hypothetical protein